MRILVVGDWHSELHEEVVMNAFKVLGHEVKKFSWHDYFKSNNQIDAFNKKFQNRFIIGPIIWRINRDMIRSAAEFSPEMIFVYRGTHITASTLKKLRQQHTDVILVGYNNDDPFAEGHHYSLWKHFLKAVPEYDLMLAYRHHNLDDFLGIGAKRVELLRSWYFPERNHPVILSDEEKAKYECDVVFVGHYEADFRKSYLEELVRQGYKLKLFGPGYDWDPVLMKSPELRHLVPVRLVWGEEYNKALCGAKMALCFLSKHNRDTYTRRCFEIPATRTLMLSERTDDLASLYKEGNEVDFFSSMNEMMDKVKLYLGDEKLRQEVAKNGYLRVTSDGHDVVSRMRQLLGWVAAIKSNEGNARG